MGFLASDWTITFAKRCTNTRAGFNGREAVGGIAAAAKMKQAGHQNNCARPGNQVSLPLSLASTLLPYLLRYLLRALNVTDYNEPAYFRHRHSPARSVTPFRTYNLPSLGPLSPPLLPLPAGRRTCSPPCEGDTTPAPLTVPLPTAPPSTHWEIDLHRPPRFTCKMAVVVVTVIARRSGWYISALVRLLCLYNRLYSWGCIGANENKQDGSIMTYHEPGQMDCHCRSS